MTVIDDLTGENEFEPRPSNEISVPFRVSSNKMIYNNNDSFFFTIMRLCGRLRDRRHCFETRVFINQSINQSINQLIHYLAW